VKRRLRKKLRLKEFQEMGFHVSYRFVPGTSPEARERHVDEFIAFIEEHQLTCGGGVDEAVQFFIAHHPPGSVSADQRALVAAWLEARNEAGSLNVGPLVDAWHD